MITTSDKYKTAVSKSGRHFRLKIDIAGVEYTGIKNFKLKGGTNSLDQITFGDAVSSYIEFILTDVPQNTILKGRQAIPYIGLELDDGTVEWMKKGVYNLENPVRSGEFIKLTAYDNFALCYKGFFTGLSGNQKIADILQEQYQKIGIAYAGGADDVTYNVNSLQGLTIIEAISVLAAYCGKNAIMDKDGKLRLVWYTDAGLTISPSRFADPLEMDEEDTFINRLDCTIDEEHSVSAGTGVGIYFSCPGMTQERITVLYNRIKGFTYRAAKLNWRMAQPDVEAGDLVRVMDNAGNVYAIPLMDYEFNCDGGFYGTIQSKGKTEQEQDTGYKGPLQTKVDRTYSDLVSTKQVITDKITAFEGEFETMNINYLEINKKLTALDAEIENLDVTELTAKVAIIETSYVSKEYVQELYATKAEVHVLDVDLERVNTLLAGSVTAGSTQTIVLNADNTTISNALIKSAMIDSVAANKVTAGTIDASSIHFKSQSGRLDIFGETIQIKDTVRQRVQIGKDASGDYNMYVWDAAGKLMFDATGITASGIQRPIIVDNMVADNANISGDKINITSLVKEINDGTEVIKSSHILVDGANQSLSVVYNTITGDLSTLSTALSVEQGKISTLITDVSQAKGDVSTLQTNYSSLTQTVNGINSTVSSHTSSIENLNNMEIGGRNLAEKTNQGGTGWAWSTQVGDKTVSEVTENGVRCCKFVRGNTAMAGWSVISYDKIGRMKYMPSRHYTISFEVKASVATFFIASLRGGNGENPLTNNVQTNATVKDTWTRIIVVLMTVDILPENVNQVLYLNNMDSGIGVSYIFRNLKIEEGNKPTPWTPAPEDVDASIKTVSDKTSTLEQTVNGFDARITSVTSTAGNALTKANEVSATVDGFSGRISSVETTANSASSKVTEITATVNGLSTTVANKTDKGAIISTINQSAEAIKIQASHLDLSGYVTISNGVQRYKYTIDLSSSSYNVNTYYPVVGGAIPNEGYHMMSVDVQLDSGAKPSWSTHASGFSVNFTVYAKASGWGRTNGNGWIQENSYSFCDKMPAYFQQMSYSSSPVFYLRGGGKYFIYCDFSTAWKIYTSKYDTNQSAQYPQYVEPTTSPTNSYVIAEPSNIGSWCASQDKTFINGGKIYTGSVTAAQIAAGTITATQIASNAITAVKIASKTITADKISISTLSALTANLGTVTAGSLTSSTTINVTTDLKVGNNIYLNQSVNSIKQIYFASGNMIMNTWTSSYNYLTVRSDYRCALVSGSFSVWASAGNKDAGISVALGNYIRFETSRNQIQVFAEAGSTARTLMRPSVNGGGYLGTTSYRWNTGFFTNAITASDLKEKQVLQSYDMRARDFINALKPIAYHRTGEGDTGSRIHYGFGAQTVASTIRALGLGNLSMAQASIVNPDGTESPYHGESIDDNQLSWGLNYNEFIPPMVSVLQEHEKEIMTIKQQRQQDAQELQQELQKRDFEISQLQHRIQQLESRS